MISIRNECNNPYFNLALEEYAVKHLNPEETYVMLWQNEPSVIVGRNQNTIEEINLKYVKDNNIPVVRRLSGGGTVYHDLGNLNFSFIVKNDKDVVSNFKKFTEPVISALRALGVNAEFSGRSNLTIHGRKFSGNAQYYFGNRLLHHGTILFNSDLSIVKEALNVKQDKIESRGVKSVRSIVSNIYPYLPIKIDIAEFKDTLLRFLTQDDNYKEKEYVLSKEDLNSINELMECRYTRWEWNYGQSPDFNIEKIKSFDEGDLELKFSVSSGILKNLTIRSDLFKEKEIEKIKLLLMEKPYREEIIRSLLSTLEFNKCLPGLSAENFIECLFY